MAERLAAALRGRGQLGSGRHKRSQRAQRKSLTRRHGTCGIAAHGPAPSLPLRFLSSFVSERLAVALPRRIPGDHSHSLFSAGSLGSTAEHRRCSRWAPRSRPTGSRGLTDGWFLRLRARERQSWNPPLRGCGTAGNGFHAGSVLCGHRISVICELPKLERRVRFPLPAPAFALSGDGWQVIVRCFGATKAAVRCLIEAST